MASDIAYLLLLPVELLVPESIMSEVEGIIASCPFPAVVVLDEVLFVQESSFYLTQLGCPSQSLHIFCMLLLHVFLTCRIGTMSLLGSIVSNVLDHHTLNKVCYRL